MQVMKNPIWNAVNLGVSYFVSHHYSLLHCDPLLLEVLLRTEDAKKKSALENDRVVCISITDTVQKVLDCWVFCWSRVSFITGRHLHVY